MSVSHGGCRSPFNSAANVLIPVPHKRSNNACAFLSFSSVLSLPVCLSFPLQELENHLLHHEARKIFIVPNFTTEISICGFAG